MFITLDTAKKHINVDSDWTEDDSYILTLIAASEDITAKRLNVKSLNDLVDPHTGYIPESVRHSCLLLIGNFYANREATTGQNANELPFGYEYIASLNKNYRSPF